MPVRVPLARLLLSAAWTLAAGCQVPSPGAAPKDAAARDPLRAPDSGDGPVAPSFDPIVIPRAGKAAAGGDEASQREKRAVEEADEGWREKLDLARQLMVSGQDAQALTVLRAALSQEPPPEWAARLREVKTELRLRRAEEGVLRIEARPVKDVVRFGSDVEFRLRVRNVSKQTLVVPASGGASSAPRAGGPPRPGESVSSPSVFTLEVLRRDRDVYATQLERRWTTIVPLVPPGGDEFVLAPDAFRDFPVRIPAEDVGTPIAGVRVLELSGTLRPAGLVVDDEPETLLLRVRKGRVVVLPDGYEPLAADPLAGLARAIPLAAPAHVLVATEFMPRQDSARAAVLLAQALADGEPGLATAAQGALAMLRERNVGEPLGPLVEPLLAALETRPERAAELIAGLTMLVDVRLAPDARLWLDWWRRTRAESPVVAPPVSRTPSGGLRAPTSPGRSRPAR